MKMITLITIGVMFSVSVKAEDFTINSREITSSYQTQSPAGEQVQCFPSTQVKKWAARKKKKAPEKVVEKVPVIVEVEKIVEKIVQEEYPRNSLSLLGGRATTGLNASTALLPTKSTLSAKTSGEFDLGLMYQRRLGDRWRASGLATKNGSLYLGIGYDF